MHARSKKKINTRTRKFIHLLRSAAWQQNGEQHEKDSAIHVSFDSTTTILTTFISAVIFITPQMTSLLLRAKKNYAHGKQGYDNHWGENTFTNSNAMNGSVMNEERDGTASLSELHKKV